MELALLTPVLVLLLLALVQLAVVVRYRLAVEHATREAVRTASVDPDVGAIAAAAHRVLPGAHVTVGARPEVGAPVRVEVHYHLVTDLPLVGVLFPDPDLDARATMRVER